MDGYFGYCLPQVPYNESKILIYTGSEFTNQDLLRFDTFLLLEVEVGSSLEVLAIVREDIIHLGIELTLKDFLSLITLEYEDPTREFGYLPQD